MIAAMGVQDDAERFEPASAEEWSAVAGRPPRRHPGRVAGHRRGGEADRAFGYEAAIVEALRWGWVDSTQRPLDEHRSMMWYAPRRRGSVWTRRNKERVSRLQAEGRMEPAGAAAVAAARASGMWTLMDPVEDLVVPDDLADALAARPGAREHWEALHAVGPEAGAGLDRAGQAARDPGRAGGRGRRGGRARRARPVVISRRPPAGRSWSVAAAG